MGSNYFDEYYGEKPEASLLPKMYDQIFVDTLKNEIEHYKKLYREELITSQALRRKVKNGRRT